MKKLILILLVSTYTFAQNQQENAALVYWKACALTTQEVWQQNSQSSDFARLTEEQKLNKLFDQNNDAITEVIKASQLSHCKFILASEYNEGVNLLLPHIGKMIGLCRLVVLNGRYYALKKEWDQATERYIAAMNFSYHIHQDPTLISCLASYATLGMSLSAIRKTVADDSFPQHLLIKIKKQLAKIASGMYMEKAFISEASSLLAPYRKDLEKNDISAFGSLLKEGINEKQRQIMQNISLKDVISQQDIRIKVASTLKIPASSLVSKSAIAQYLLQGLDEYSQHANKLADICRSSYESGVKEYLLLTAKLPQLHFCVRSISPIKTYKTQLRMYSNINMTLIFLELIEHYKNTKDFPKSLSKIENLSIEFYQLDNFTYSKDKIGFKLQLVEPVSKRKFVYRAFQGEDGKLHWDCTKFVEKRIDEQEQGPK